MHYKSLILPHKPIKTHTTMKKVLFTAAVLVASLASCKKDHTCTCTTTTSGSGVSVTGDPVVTEYPKSKKAAARAHCLSYTTTGNGYTSTTDCDLK
ncbi:MAG: hypothetical protein K0Q95_1236 [Bacteroidota bacterium]|jgi:hypothetical protein|nr:hypothetical protein [Bacteroidota bacterium]